MSIYPPPGEEETSPTDAKDSRGEGGGEKGGRVLVVSGLAGGLVEGGSTQAGGCRHRSHAVLSLALPGLQGEDESHRLPVEGPADQGGSAESLHEEI